MRSWAHVPCDPYVRVQNTGVSVLFQGFFFRPADAPLAAITAEHNNVILASTHSTGMSLSALDDIKRAGGVDTRPLRAMMSVSCFVRMPRVQLSFRFMGPDDASQTQRLLDRAEMRQRSVSRPGGVPAAATTARGPRPARPSARPSSRPCPGTRPPRSWARPRTPARAVPGLAAAHPPGAAAPRRLRRGVRHRRSRDSHHPEHALKAAARAGARTDARSPPSHHVLRPEQSRTITAQTLEGALPVDILLRLNRATGLQMDAAEAHAIVEDARRTLFIGTSLALVNLRHAHDKHLVERQPMFATSDYSSWARPTVGLKRTFCPRPPP